MQHHQVVSKLFKEHFGDRADVCGIEIGTLCGDLTRTVLWTLPTSKLYTIDPWEHRDKAEFEAGEPQEYHNANKEAAEQRLCAPEFEGRVCILAMKSSEAHKFIIEKNPDKKFDWVWIDGDHSEQGITTDLELFEGLVKEGGIFGGHDYGQCHPLTEIIQAKYGDKIITSDDFTWWILK